MRKTVTHILCDICHRMVIPEIDSQPKLWDNYKLNLSMGIINRDSDNYTDICEICTKDIHTYIMSIHERNIGITKAAEL